MTSPDDFTAYARLANELIGKATNDLCRIENIGPVLADNLRTAGVVECQVFCRASIGCRCQW